MKKIFITALLLSATWQVNSQEIYKGIFSNAEKVVNNPKSNAFLVDVCNFEMMALKYMKQQAFKESQEVSTDFLDTQADYMTKFVNSFFKRMAELRESPSDQKKMIYKYMRTSLRTPLFNDSDEETTECFSSDSTSVIRFSLNTDWKKAYEQVVKN